tara:strand:- start:2247 stop:2831 length:585 start_codon:yes stop_codon:yes gene_type:complete
MPVLEVRNGLKAFVFSLLMMLLGAGAIFLVDVFAHDQVCDGRYKFFCDILQSFPYEVRFGFWILFGAFFVYFATIQLVSVLRRRIILRLDNEGITFNFGEAVLVPWSQVVSFEIKNRSLIFNTLEAVDARNMLGWRAEREKIVVPLSAGKARLDGKKMSGNATKNVANWLLTLTSALRNQKPQTDGGRIEPRLS